VLDVFTPPELVPLEVLGELADGVLDAPVDAVELTLAPSIQFPFI
jgi:hypothetical protein